VVISFSLALLFGVIMFFMIRGGVIKWGPAIVAILFGFSLASTGAADPIEDFLDGVVEAVDNVDDSINDTDGQ
jgi:intracellular septation protein A